MSGCLFLCRVCFPNPGEEKTLGIPRRACDYCGALCSNGPNGPLPQGSLVNASDAPPPRALSRAEIEAQVRPVEPPRPPPAPECSLPLDCAGNCHLSAGHEGDCVCLCGYGEPEVVTNEVPTPPEVLARLRERGIRRVCDGPVRATFVEEES